ncbi:MAG: hypothetical protein AAFZ65_01550 [Planctomycetota bacterium]
MAGVQVSKLTFAAALVLALAACSDDDDFQAFVVQPAEFVGLRGGATTVTGVIGIYLADEQNQAGGSDLNGDGDTTDGVAVAVRFDSLTQTCLGAVPTEVAISGGTAFLVVEEADNLDWNLNGIDERVLLRWSLGDETPEFIAVLDPESPRGVVATSFGVFWAVDENPAGADETNLRFAPFDDVLTEEVVLTDGITLGAGRYELLGIEEIFVLVGVDETNPESQGDSNGDGDDLDQAVLALIDTSQAEQLIVGTGLAMPSVDAPVDAEFEGGSSWEFAVLVSEQAQAGENLNGGFTPAICAAPDTDLDDDVLHRVRFDAGAVEEVVNTTIAGTGRVYAGEDFLGALVDEASIGPAGCDLTNDGSVDDLVLRIAPYDMAELPVDIDDLYLPLDASIPGGSQGVTVAGNRFVAAVAPEFVVPNALPGATTLGQLDPLLDVEWQFLHEDTDPQFPDLTLNVSWMASEVSSGRVAYTFLEEGLGQNLNQSCGLDVKDEGLPDMVDELPGVLRFPSAGQGTASGFGYAVEPSGPTTIAFGQIFFRVDEAADGVDWNGDGALDDSSLFRSNLVACLPVRMADIDAGVEAPVVTDGSRGALIYTDENEAGEDLNGDGVIGGLAVRFFSAF